MRTRITWTEYLNIVFLTFNLGLVLAILIEVAKA